MLSVPIVLFGGNGYLGGALCHELLKRGCRVIVADLHENRAPPGADFVRADITSPEQVRNAIPEGAIVANFAGIADLNKAKHQPKECIEVNIFGHYNILKACVDKRAQKFLYASSAYVYSTHGSFYRISKRTCEEYTVEFGKKFDLPYLILRYGSLYGGASDESNGMHRIVRRALLEKRLSYDGSPTDSREFIHVSDASDITADLLQGEESNTAYLLTGTERYTMAELFALISEIMAEPVDIEFGQSQNSDHYKMTQYNFVPIQAKRISKPLHTDLGNGLMDLINNLFVKHVKEEVNQ